MLNRWVRSLVAVGVVACAGCESLQPIMPKPTNEKTCLVFLFHDPLHDNRKLEMNLAQDTSIKLHAYTYTKFNQDIGDRYIDIKDGGAPWVYTYSCRASQKHYFKTIFHTDENPKKSGFRIQEINHDQALSRLQHFRFVPVMLKSE